MSQNLITNGDFEQYKKCPDDISQINRAMGWRTPSEGTSDYFNACSNNWQVSVPKNICGKLYAQSGNAYAGFGIFVLGNKARYEFIQSKLSNHLEAKKEYCLTFYLAPSNKSTFNNNLISCIVSKKEIEMKEWQFYKEEDINENTYLKYSIGRKKTWDKVCFLFTAKGNEDFITIGFDKINMISISKSSKNKELEDYLYIDNQSRPKRFLLLNKAIDFIEQMR